jgi:hypothetical protein
MISLRSRVAWIDIAWRTIQCRKGNLPKSYLPAWDWHSWDEIFASVWGTIITMIWLGVLAKGQAFWQQAATLNRISRARFGEMLAVDWRCDHKRSVGHIFWREGHQWKHLFLPIVSKILLSSSGFALRKDCGLSLVYVNKSFCRTSKALILYPGTQHWWDCSHKKLPGSTPVPFTSNTTESRTDFHRMWRVKSPTKRQRMYPKKIPSCKGHYDNPQCFIKLFSNSEAGSPFGYHPAHFLHTPLDYYYIYKHHPYMNFWVHRNSRNNSFVVSYTYQSIT